MRFVSCVCLFVFLVGCSGSETKEVEDIELYKVTGTITVNGEPVGGVSVGFQPERSGDEATEGIKGGGGGSTNEKGEFSIVYRDGREGLPPGKYYVLLSRLVTPDGSPIPPNVMAADVDAVNQFPEKLNSVDGTTFFADVAAGDNAPLSFDVKVKK